MIKKFLCFFLSLILISFFCINSLAGWVNTDPDFVYALNAYSVQGYNNGLPMTDNYLEDLPYGLNSGVLEIGRTPAIAGNIKSRIAFVFDKNDFISNAFLHSVDDDLFHDYYIRNFADVPGEAYTVQSNTLADDVLNNRLGSMIVLLNGSDKDVWTYYASITGSPGSYTVTVRILSDSPIVMYNNSGDISMSKAEYVGNSTTANSLLDTLSHNASDESTIYANDEIYQVLSSEFYNNADYNFYYYEASYSSVEYIAYNRVMLNPQTLTFSIDDWALKSSTPCYFCNFPVRNDFRLDSDQYRSLINHIDYIKTDLDMFWNSFLTFNTRFNAVATVIEGIKADTTTIISWLSDINSNLQDASALNHEDLQTVVTMLSDMLSYGNTYSSDPLNSSTVSQTTKDYFGSSYDIVVPENNQNLMLGMSAFKSIFEHIDMNLGGVLTVCITLILLLGFIGYVMGRRLNK